MKDTIVEFVEIALQMADADCCIEISQLWRLYDALSEGIKNQPLSRSEIMDMLWLNLKGTCPQCGWTITGDDLGNLWTKGKMGFDNVIIYGSGRALRFGKGLCLNEMCSSEKIVLSWRPYYELFRKQKDVEGLMKVLETEKYWFARKKAAEALGRTGDTRAVQPLIAVLKDKGEAALRDKEADEKADVRWKAAVALGEIGDSRAVEPLEELLGDRDEYRLVQEAANEALQKIKKGKAQR